MIEEVFYHEPSDFRWIDVISPTEEEYEKLAKDFQLHPAAVKDCLSPMHLPKCERIGDVFFLILRLHDLNAAPEADEVGELTNKIAIFSSQRFLITIHRKDAVYISDIKSQWKLLSLEEQSSKRRLLNEIIDSALSTYEEGLVRYAREVDILERKVFEEKKHRELVGELYLVKRKSSVFRRMLHLTRNMLEKFRRQSEASDPFSNDLQETADSLYFTADDLHENANNLVNLHLSLASHRTNEVMGVLTIISVFFLPLTFIVGVYGMNFSHMPELDSRFGYFGVWLIMILITGGIYVWFKKKNWL